MAQTRRQPGEVLSCTSSKVKTMKQLDTDIVVGSVGHLLLGVFCSDVGISLSGVWDPHVCPFRDCLWNALLLHAKCQRVLQVPSPRVISHHWELIDTCGLSLSWVWVISWDLAVKHKMGSLPSPRESCEPSPREVAHQNLPSTKSSVWDSGGGSSLKLWLFPAMVLVLWEAPLSAGVFSCTQRSHPCRPGSAFPSS